MPKESVIKHYSSSTTGAAPTAADLVEGELAINTADERIYFENASGQVVNFGESRGISATYARRSSVVSSLNGLTGAVSALVNINSVTPSLVSNFVLAITGDGGAVRGFTPSIFNSGDLEFGIAARLATASLTGVASFPATDFAVSSAGAVSVTGNFVRTVVVGGSTLTGNVSLTAGSNITLTPSGSTITIASSGGGGGGVTTTAQNTWTATQYFNAGLSATGATFTGAITGATATFGRLLTANAGISASGITANSGFFGKFGVNSTNFIDVTSTSAITISSFNSLINIACPTDTIDGGGGQVAIGDNDGVGNNTYIYVDDENYAIDLNAAVAVNINSNLNVYSNLDNYGNANFGLNVNPNNGPSVTGRNGVAIGAGAINAQTVGYNLVAADNGKVITMNSSSALTVTAGTAVGTTGFSCTIIQLGTGTVRLAASGVTMNSYSGLTFAGQHAAASLVCYQTNVFNVSGNLTP